MKGCEELKHGKEANVTARINIGGMTYRVPPANDPAGGCLRGRAVGLRRSGTFPWRLVPGRRARRKTAGPPKISQKNTGHPWMYAPGLSNAKKEGDLRGEEWGCDGGEKKEERVLGAQ